MNWKEHQKKLLNAPEFMKAYEALEPEYKLASNLIRLRLESGGPLPSLSTVKKIADVPGAELEINLRPKPRSREDVLLVKSKT